MPHRIPCLLLLFGILCLPGDRWTSPPLTEHTKHTKHYPSEIEWIKDTYPYFTYDRDAYLRATQEAAREHAAVQKTGTEMWRQVGPSNIPGRISDVAFDPVNPTIAYAGSAAGGVYKSVDTGVSWFPIFDDQPTLSIGDIAVDPNNPSTLYVGTGEANGGHNNMLGYGVFKSEDGGQTWKASGLENTSQIARIVVDPNDSQRVYVAAIGSYFHTDSNRGVYRSLNGGATWEQVLFVDEFTGAIDLVIRPDNPNVLFAATWFRTRTVNDYRVIGETSGIYRSVDGGTTWKQLGAENGLPDSDRLGRIGIAICRDYPDTMYALFMTASGLFGDYYGLYRSDDGGENWVNADPDSDVRHGTATFSWYFGQVRVAPDNPDIVYVLDVLFMQSTDGGATWSYDAGTHVDYHALAFHPENPQHILVGNDGGITASIDRGNPNSWHAVPQLANTQFYEIGLHPTDPQQFFGGTQDNGTLMSQGPDYWEKILGGDGFYVLVDPVQPTTVYAELQFGGLWKILRVGTPNAAYTQALSGIDENLPTNWSTPVAIDPSNNHILYYGTDRIHRTTDGARSWTEVSAPLVSPPAVSGLDLFGTVTTIAVSPVNPDVIYAGTDDGNVWVSEDYAVSWTDVSSNLPRRWVTRVVPDPADANTAYVAFSGRRWFDYEPRILRTRDLGNTWQDISEDLVDAPVNAFAVDPTDVRRLFAGTDLGAYMSTDDGQNWTLLGNGMPLVSVYDMKIFYDGQTLQLVAGTHGRSMYTLDLSTVPSTTQPPAAPIEMATLSGAYPNPFDHQVTLEYSLSRRGTATLDIYDVTGRQIRTIVNTARSAGTHRAVWNARAVASGTYFARLTVTADNQTAAQTMVLHRN